jgi:cystathionine gamma-synthase
MASDSGAPPLAVNGDNQDGPGKLAAVFDRQLSIASLALHADDYINTHPAVAPPMHVSTTFRYADNPDELSRFYNRSVRDTHDL